MIRALAAPLACLALAAGLATAGEAAAVEAGPDARRIDQLAARLAAGPDAGLHADLARILREADRICALPLAERVATLADLDKPGERRVGRIGKVDSRTQVVARSDPIKGEKFALASSDTDTTALAVRELPLLAAAFRLTGEARYRERIAAQLAEMARWTPLQRPGWTLYTAENDLPADGNDGVWLATGTGILAIVRTLDLLPAGSLPAELVQRLRGNLADEAARIRSDWERKVPWYVRSRAVISNQWVVPSAGLVLATAHLGRAADQAGFELGVANLLASLEALGDEGAVSEGMIYAAHWTAPYLYLAARAAAEAGDRRLADHPFLQRFPRWLALCFQPGRQVVNAFDGYTATRAGEPNLAGDIAQLASLSADPELGWVQRAVFGSPFLTLDIAGLLSLAQPADALREPPRFGSYQRANWAVWRSAWRADASGLWMRGGHPQDFHDHRDRGHISFTVDGLPVLIEAGTPTYSYASKARDFDSVRGHNVLEVGDRPFVRRSVALLDVRRLDAEGGEIAVDAGAGYPGTAEPTAPPGHSDGPVRSEHQGVAWRRTATWTARTLEVADTVTLAAADSVRFRWHLGSEQALALNAPEPTRSEAVLPAGRMTFPGWVGGAQDRSTGIDGLDWIAPASETIASPAVRISVQADQALRCREERMLDHTFKFRRWEHRHAVLVVESAAPVRAITIRTRIEVPADQAPR